MTPVTPPTLEEIERAATLLKDVTVHTPLVPLHSYDSPEPILLKLEIHQPVTSFKVRGVFHAVASLTPDQRDTGISTVSAGNTAQALAWVGRRFGVAARAVMPESAPASKVRAVEAYGGTPVLVSIDEVFRFLQQHLWEQEPYAFIHPWTNRDVLIGHATLALEVLEDCPDVETVFIPVGGGGLLGGVGSALRLLRPDVRIVAVEPEQCAALHASLQADRAVAVQCQTICDGVAVPYLTEEMFPLLRDIVDDVALVAERQVEQTVQRLALGNRVIAEPSGALAAAAALSQAPADRGRSVCLVTGGSIDQGRLVEILTRDEV